MAVEIEAKIKLDQTQPVAARLRQAGAVPIGEFLETNVFFDTDDRSMLAADEGLRLRSALDLATGAVRHTMTHKGPHRYGQLKSREETEVGVTDADSATQLLQRLGYVRVLSFQKKRQSWKLANCRIEIDEVPLLGHFLEIEGPTEESVMLMREAIGLGDRPIIKASYVALLLSHLQEQGRTSADICFASPPAAAEAG